MPTLRRMRTPGYDGTPCELTSCKSRGRVGARLPDGRTVAVKLECVDHEGTPEACPACLEPLFDPISTRLVCGHAMHWYCLDQWRGTAVDDVEAAGARCPVCRAYIGLSSELPALEMDAELLVFQALGAIVQTVARLDGRPEPSFDEEMATVVEQMRRARQQCPGWARDLDALRRRYVASPSDANGRALREALQSVLVVHCFPRGAERTASSNCTAAIRQWLDTLSEGR